MNTVLVRNKKIPLVEFLVQRRQVLSQWLTGAEVDLDEAVAYHQSLMNLGKNAVYKLRQAKDLKDTLVGARAGQASLEGQILLLKGLEEKGEVEKETVLQFVKKHADKI